MYCVEWKTVGNCRHVPTATQVAELRTNYLLCYMVAPFLRPPSLRPIWKMSMSSTKIYISQFRTASRSIYIYIYLCTHVRGTGCGIVVYLPVMWMSVRTAYRGASCVKLYVDDVALCNGEFHSQLLLFPTQTSIVLPPQPHCHHALCALSLSLIPVVTLVNLSGPVEVLPC
jgi:hypothetical protein